QAEGELDDARDRRVEDRVEEREPRDGIAPNKFEVLEADEFAAAPDLGVGEAQPCAEPEGIREKRHQQRRGGQQEQQPEDVAIFEPTLLASGPADYSGRCGSHVLRTSRDRDAAALPQLSSRAGARDLLFCKAGSSCGKASPSE